MLVFQDKKISEKNVIILQTLLMCGLSEDRLSYLLLYSVTISHTRLPLENSTIYWWENEIERVNYVLMLLGRQFRSSGSSVLSSPDYTVIILTLGYLKGKKRDYLDEYTIKMAMN